MRGACPNSRIKFRSIVMQAHRSALYPRKRGWIHGRRRHVLQYLPTMVHFLVLYYIIFYEKRTAPRMKRIIISLLLLIYEKKERKFSLISHSISLVWSICATVNEESRFRVDNFIREIEGTFPLRDTVYEYFVDSRLRMYVSWEERLPTIWKIPSE